MNFGFIGGGNMATALMGGIIKSGLLKNTDIYVYDVSETASKKIKDSFDVHIAGSIEEICGKCDMILLAVKPNVAPKLLEENWARLENRAVISICAGLTVKTLEKASKNNCRLLRVMPNTPAMVGKGMSALCVNTNFTDKEKTFSQSLFESVGKSVWLEEKQISAIIGVSGSGPAYVYMMIEAMADGGVEVGLPRSLAYTLAAQTLLGSAAMVLETGKHPGELKDMVCSPGGTTIAAVHSLEESGIRAALMNAVCTAAQKADEMEETAKKQKKKVK